ncbi:putative endopeptidase [Monocercomonoides exilis]|uniref:putative endopeptidase n=1 Tax=Monocercomonoides exilis TaxID=2049356 RepID=UPI003559DE56|nr:putative endopeptidase [Monocercomonoides exilis]|eukprot:MONOS_6904.1-p1 / transcript=MONOS_6904.1 / gene=MONOS_6904 / organism=Monocercomonoides_exilis_PA203 / gene_product=endopeptidase / transcript_product=endopeptidase / location=Mono_scaffold00226:41190-43218(+) / protein_length=353 / sequence_SO=supercontig / SO=protein_coding / is_pseudo=false
MSSTQPTSQQAKPIMIDVESLLNEDTTPSTPPSRIPTKNFISNGNERKTKPNRPSFHKVQFPTPAEQPGMCPRHMTIERIPPGAKAQEASGQTRGGKNHPLLVFLPDDRVELHNVTYPWSTVGLLLSVKGVCTGTLVDDDIVLTASHCIPWREDGSIDRIRFLPAFHGKESPFGYSDVETVYAFTRNSGRINTVQAAFDVACLKLKRKFGPQTGYSGTIKYNPRWSAREDWMNVGYPQPDTGIKDGIIPLFQDSGKILTVEEYSVGSLSSFIMQTTFDLTKGHSGGPVFGWFEGEEFPRVVAVVSSESGPSPQYPMGRNNLAGGPSLTFMVGYVRALNEQANNNNNNNSNINN